jgi:hypothetical protein
MNAYWIRETLASVFLLVSFFACVLAAMNSC